MTTPSRQHDDDDHRGFLRRHGVALIVATTLLGAGLAAVARLAASPGAKPVKVEAIVMIRPLPPPSLPLPPPPRVKEPPMIKQSQVIDEKKPDPVPAPPTNGVTADNIGPGSGMILPPSHGGGGGQTLGAGSPFGWYAVEVQQTIGDALRRNPATRNAAFQLEVRVWADNSGRVTRSLLHGTSGDPKLDDAIQRNVLDGLQLQEPPPADMPMPIVMRFTLSRPNFST